MKNKSLLPLIYQDKNNLILENLARFILDIDIKKFMIYPIENAQDNILEELSKEYHIEGYEGWKLAKTREEKQNLIKNSILHHFKKGSIPSIKEALKNFGFEAEIEEFFEYGGRPSHFKIKFINIYNRSLDDEFEKDIKELINCYKPKTRKLDLINYFLCEKVVIYFYSRFQTIEKTTIKTKGAVL